MTGPWSVWGGGGRTPLNNKKIRCASLPVAMCLCSHSCFCRRLFAPLVAHIQAQTHHAPQKRHGMCMPPPIAWSGLCGRSARLLMRAPLAHNSAQGQVNTLRHGARFLVPLWLVLVLLWFSYGIVRCRAVFLRCRRVRYGAL
jgi:hypothetical protein